jgi:amidase
VLVIDTHPLCPTADSIKGSLNGLTDRLAKLGCRVLRQSPELTDWREQRALMANC